MPTNPSSRYVAETKEANKREAETRKRLLGRCVTANPKKTAHIRDPDTGKARPMTRLERQRWT